MATIEKINASSSLASRLSATFDQDRVRKERQDAITQMRDSYIKFNGQKTGWDVSIVDREFGHRNNESMLVLWEKDLKRFPCSSGKKSSTNSTSSTTPKSSRHGL